MESEYQNVFEFTNGCEIKLKIIHKLAIRNTNPKINLFCCRRFSSKYWFLFYEISKNIYRFFPLARGILHPQFLEAKLQGISEIYFDYETLGQDLELISKKKLNEEEKKTIAQKMLKDGLFGPRIEFSIDDLYFLKTDLPLILSELPHCEDNKSIVMTQKNQNKAAENKILRLEALIVAIMEIAHEEIGEPLTVNAIAQKAQSMFDEKNNAPDIIRGFNSSTFRNDVKKLQKKIELSQKELNHAIEIDLPKTCKKYDVELGN